MSRPPIIPLGSWPRRMGAELAAAYCGESSVGAFIKRVGAEYPQPRVCEGRRRLWLKDDLDAAILPPELVHAATWRGICNDDPPLPRFVVAKALADGRVAFYFYVPGKYRRLGCPVPNQPLGRDYTVACGEDGKAGRAAALNALFDEWQDVRCGLPVTGERAPVYGTIRWLFQEYRRSKAYTERVSARSRPDYERTCCSSRISARKKAISLATEKLGRSLLSALIRFTDYPCRPRWRATTASRKAVALCRRAWRVVHRSHPNEFSRDVPNPWDGVTLQRRIKNKKKL